MKAYNEYILHRGSAARSMALDIGSLAHVALETKLRGGDWIAACEEYLAGLPIEVGGDVGDDFEILRPSLALWTPPDDWEIIGVEQELDVECGEHTIVGRLDAIVLWGGLYWHLQHKTLAPTVPLPAYAELQRTDWHECVYQRMAERAGYTPFGGTILNVIRKQSRKSLAEKGPANALVPPQYLPRDEQGVDEAMADLAQLIDDIAGGADGSRRVVKQRTACAGPFRNSLCIYKPVCDGTDTINSERYVDLEPRYSESNV